MFIGIGALIMLIGIVWFIVLSIQTGTSTAEKIVWALVNFFLQPLGGIIFFIMKKDGLIPLILVLIGFLVYGYGFFTSATELMP